VTRPSAVALLLLAAPAAADEKLFGIACRSVHLGYPAPAGTAFYNELTVERSAPGTYFCACGFNHGYFGAQELADGKKLVIFSVWDPTRGDDPKAVPADQRVKVLHKGDGVRVGRFGGEGTGGQSFLDLDWKPGETLRFLVTATADGADRTAFAARLYRPDRKRWDHLVTFSTRAADRLAGYYSFVEDFKRDRRSAQQVRKAAFGNGWVRAADSTWTDLVTARFTADANPATNIDAGAAGGRFFLATGGDTANATAKLKDRITRPAGTRPTDLPAD
jgi:hypothetical protein